MVGFGFYCDSTIDSIDHNATSYTSSQYEYQTITQMAIDEDEENIIVEQPLMTIISQLLLFFRIFKTDYG